MRVFSASGPPPVPADGCKESVRSSAHVRFRFGGKAVRGDDELWEGVDVPGWEALRIVVLDKIHWPPNDPVVAAAARR